MSFTGTEPTRSGSSVWYFARDREEDTAAFGAAGISTQPPTETAEVGSLHREVWIRGYIHEVVIGRGGEVIARHRRSYDHEDLVFDPVHYLVVPA